MYTPEIRGEELHESFNNKAPIIAVGFKKHLNTFLCNYQKIK